MKSEIIFTGTMDECVRCARSLFIAGGAWRVVIHPAAPMGQFQLNATLK